jgi:hypothetical protein
MPLAFQHKENVALFVLHNYTQLSYVNMALFMTLPVLIVFFPLLAAKPIIADTPSSLLCEGTLVLGGFGV